MSPAPSILEQALDFATKWHTGQVSRNGEPYILHCIRVMLKQTTELRKIVALLHDVLEDTSADPDELEALFGRAALSKVLLLSREKEESYNHYIRDKVCTDIDCMHVKLADIEDNTDVRRMDIKAAKNFPMYKEAYDYIIDHLNHAS